EHRHSVCLHLSLRGYYNLASDQSRPAPALPNAFCSRGSDSGNAGLPRPHAVSAGHDLVAFCAMVSARSRDLRGVWSESQQVTEAWDPRGCAVLRYQVQEQMFERTASETHRWQC